MRQIKIYVASKLRHAARIKEARSDGFHFNARWLDTGNLAANAAKPVTHWLEENFDDIRGCDYLIVYAEAGEHLKTAIGEAFYAIAHGKPVFVLGEHADYVPWCFLSPQVRRATDFEAALNIIRSECWPKPHVIEGSSAVLRQSTNA